MHGVTIGNIMRDNKCPIISDGVFIGAGAKIIGDVFLAKKVKVGANAVVTKSIDKVDVTVIGIPAYILHKSNDDRSNLE
jgi:serine O-acetyltransferase